MSNNKFKVLIVEDEANICSFIETLLTTNDYQALVAHTCTMGLTLFASHNPDLVILDLGLPDMDGSEIIRSVRAWSRMPIIIISARSAEIDKAAALDMGADDYLAKPFGVRELIARVRALLRRGTLEAPDSGALVAAGITLDEDRHTAVGPNGPIDLTPREFELLAALMKDAGKVVTREDLLREAWGWEYITETKTVDTHIKRLRDKISQAGFDPSIIETVRGYGYRLKA